MIVLAFICAVITVLALWLLKMKRKPDSGSSKLPVSASNLVLESLVQKARAVGPGFVIIKNALDPETQIWLANYAMKMGEDEKSGFWKSGTDGQRTLNATAGRGRIFQALYKYPDANRIKKLCLDLVAAAQQKTTKLPSMEPTHLLLLYYATADGMSWHRDSDANDGDTDQPVVSISLGNSSSFGYKPLLQKEQHVLVESGDVMIWGGPQRMLEHCVHNVQLNTAPSFLPVRNARLNFTFRSAPNILGSEDRYASDKFWVDPS